MFSNGISMALWLAGAVAAQLPGILPGRVQKAS